MLYLNFHKAIPKRKIFLLVSSSVLGLGSLRNFAFVTTKLELILHETHSYRAKNIEAIGLQVDYFNLQIKVINLYILGCPSNYIQYPLISQHLGKKHCK